MSSPSVVPVAAAVQIAAVLSYKGSIRALAVNEEQHMQRALDDWCQDSSLCCAQL